MRSTTGNYYLGLDHIRACAALIVFTWHFLYRLGGHMQPPPLFPLSILTEGHTGVALFMVLSGYLFAKLLDGKQIIYGRFIWNRALRLLPLLLLVIVVVGILKYRAGDNLAVYFNEVAWGAIKPTLPNGGWSITAEFHFYLALPLLLFLGRKWKHSLLLAVALAVVGRYFLYQETGQVQFLAYWTIIGRIDQFMLGILAFQYRHVFTNRHLLTGIIVFAFLCFFWYFDKLGGYYNSPSYPSPSSIWIYMTTMEGIAYAALIAWYDGSFQFEDKGFARFLAKVGTYSYSIYLLHFFWVFDLSRAIHSQYLNLGNIYLAMAVSVAVFFVVMVPAGYLSYRFIESPFLRFRNKYTVPLGTDERNKEGIK